MNTRHYFFFHVDALFCDLSKESSPQPATCGYVHAISASVSHLAERLDTYGRKTFTANGRFELFGNR